MVAVTEAVCIASGPSLTNADCDAVRAWRDSRSDRFVVVTNNTHTLCPWADYLYAMDNEWWRQHGKEVRATFTGNTYSRYGNYGTQKIPVHHGDNSGAGAILLAHYSGAKKIVLLGYDCQRTGGKSHWHKDHIKPLGNTQSMPHWHKYFKECRRSIPDSVEIINCTRETALTAFPLKGLEDELYPTV